MSEEILQGEYKENMAIQGITFKNSLKQMERGLTGLHFHIYKCWM